MLNHVLLRLIFTMTLCIIVVVVVIIIIIIINIIIINNGCLMIKSCDDGRLQVSGILKWSGLLK